MLFYCDQKQIDRIIKDITNNPTIDIQLLKKFIEICQLDRIL